MRRAMTLWLWCVLAGCSFRIAAVTPPATGEPRKDMAHTVTLPPTDMLATDDDLSLPGVARDLARQPEDMAAPVLTPLLTATIAPSTATPIDQTAGTLDWAHWGLSSATSFDHKSGGSAIANFVNVTGSTVGQLGTYPIGFSWSGGTPTATASDTHTGVYTQGTGAGFRLVVPADTTQRTLELYGGGQAATVQVTAHLGDGSAPDVTQSTMDAVNQFQRIVTVTYRAASSCTLTVEWTVTSATGFVHIQSADVR
jgi:hypothetical protein